MGTEAETESDGELRVGVDIGGTFTDVVTIRDGSVTVNKTPSTPVSPERGVLGGLEAAREQGGWAFESVSSLGHGTTVGTNAVLEGTWAETALLTTEGFGDVLEIGRQDRPDIYDFQVERATPIVPRDRRYEVRERLDERGRSSPIWTKIASDRSPRRFGKATPRASRSVCCMPSRTPSTNGECATSCERKVSISPCRCRATSSLRSASTNGRWRRR
jgi:hypothetical protein